MIDALHPAMLKAQEVAGQPLNEAITAVAAAAEAGREASKAMIATMGRAKTLGEQSIGHPDAGACSVVVIFDAMRDGERVELGLLVDAVSEVIDIGADQIEPAPNFGSAVRRDFIRGMGKVAHRFVIILEPDKAFDVTEMAQLCESAQEESVS